MLVGGLIFNDKFLVGGAQKRDIVTFNGHNNNLCYEQKHTVQE